MALPSLRELCVLALAKHLHNVSLRAFVAESWPEECLLSLLQCTLALGRLNEHSLRLFTAVAPSHPQLAAALRALNVRPLPPLAPSSSRGWLGQRPHLY